MKFKTIIRIAIVTALLLLIPLSAKLFTDEMAWSLFDFAFAGTLIFGTGLAFELLRSKSGAIAYRLGAGVAVAAAFLLVWISLAVGIIGSEDNPANLMYIGVLAVGFIGAFIARFEPHGMARALFATAIAQALVPVIALIIGTAEIATADQAMGIVGVFALNTFFAMLFAGSALLFRRASATGSKVAPTA